MSAQDSIEMAARYIYAHDWALAIACVALWAVPFYFVYHFGVARGRYLGRQAAKKSTEIVFAADGVRVEAHGGMKHVITPIRVIRAPNADPGGDWEFPE